MKIIFNNDDFGLCHSVNEAVILAYKAGIVKSTTLLANSNAYDEAVSLALENDGLGVGVHLALSILKPLTNPKTLVDENGYFHKLTYYKDAKIDLNEVETEFRAQIEKVVNSGIKITHLDGHHHLYALIPGVYEISKKLAKEYNVPLRNYHHESWGYDFNDEYYNISDVQGLIEILKKHQDKEILEVMCHISTDSDLEGLKAVTSYNLNRINEFKALTSIELKDYLKANNYEVVNYSLLQEEKC